jgi:protein phosphatase
MTWICGNCGAINSDEAEQCARCGAARDSAARVTAVATPPADIAPTSNGANPPEPAQPAGADQPPVRSAGPDGGGPGNALPEPPGEIEPEPGTATAAAAEQAAPPAHPTEAYWTASPGAEPSPAFVPESLASGIAPRPHTAPLGQSGDLGTAPLTRAPETVPQGYSAADAPTQILPFDPTRLHPLPVGALLDGRYMVKAQVQMLAGRNLYRAEALSQQRCPSCGFLVGRDVTTCPRCETPLTGDPPLPSYFVAEGMEQEDLVREPGLIERGLNHPNLMPLVDLFTYTPYGPPRYYTVAEARQGVTLSQFTLPRPAEQVMEWAVQLSDALTYLHEEGVISPGATPENILIKEDKAVLTNLQNARPASDDPPARARQVAEDLALLAATLYESLTGRYATVAAKDQPLLDSRYPAELEQAFTQALRPAPDAAPLTDAEWQDLITRAAAIIQAPLASIRVRSGRLSHVGMLRPMNEDSLAVVECQAVQESVSAGIGVYVVADGMGGYEGGEIASAIAIATVTEELLKHFITPQFSSTTGEPDAAQIMAWLSEAVQTANQHIHEDRSTRSNEMGTTLVATIVTGDFAYIANVGDSRAYMLRKDEPAVKQVTVDHSLVQRLVSTGQITEAEAKYHPYRNVVFRSLGERLNVEIDMFTERLRPGDRLLLCSDGLSNMVPDEAITRILAAHADPQDACTDLITQANAAGGTDNITAVIIYIEEG